MATAIIIHGLNGRPNEDWFGWLKGELEKRGYTVHIPQMPIDENQNMESWDTQFNEYYKMLDQNSVLIAHSLGVAFALNVLQHKKRQIKGAFFVAGFIERLGNHELDKIIGKFVDREFEFSEIKKKSEKFFVYASDNDPYVPYEKTKKLAEKLDTEPIIIEGAGHFNKESGYTEFEDLLIDILSMGPAEYAEE